MSDQYIGARCLVRWVDDGTDSPEDNPFTVFIAFGSYDDETATDAERVADLEVFYYVDDLAELNAIYSRELAPARCDGYQLEWLLLSYELVTGAR